MAHRKTRDVGVVAGKPEPVLVERRIQDPGAETARTLSGFVMSRPSTYNAVGHSGRAFVPDGGSVLLCAVIGMPCPAGVRQDLSGSP